MLRPFVDISDGVGKGWIRRICFLDQRKKHQPEQKPERARLALEPLFVAREKTPHPGPLPAKPGRGNKISTRELFTDSEPVMQRA